MEFEMHRTFWKQWLLNMNEHETFSGVIISFDEISFANSNTENNSANNFTFSKDLEEETKIYIAMICKAGNKNIT